jgi:hypothetical protein
LNAVFDISGFNSNGRIGKEITTLVELPYVEELETERITRYKQVPVRISPDEEDIEEVEEDEDEYICQFSIPSIRKEPDIYEELLEALDDDKFVYKKQYLAAQKYMKAIADKQKTEDDSLLDLL